MERVDAELAQLQDSLGDSGLYEEARKSELADLLKREGELKVRAAALEESWLEDQAELEGLEAE